MKLKQIIAQILISVVVTIALALGAYYAPLFPQKFGTTITTLTSGDSLSDFPTSYNANLLALNNGKIEISTTTLPLITTLSGLTSASSLATIGTITTGVWSGTTILASKGGTGSTTLSSNQVLLGNGTGNIKTVADWGTSGQFLTSGGAGAAPTWTTSAVSQSDDYNWTGTYFGIKNLRASSTAANPMYLNGIDYAMPSSEGASSTVLATNGSGSLSWNELDWQLLVSTTTSVNMVQATTTFAAATDLRVIYEIDLATGDSPSLNLNIDEGNNYGYFITEDAVTNGSLRVSDSNELRLDNNGTTSPSVYIIDITNPAGARKFLHWNRFSSQSGSMIPYMGRGVGIWNNTSAQITTIAFINQSRNVIPAGTRIRIYGSRD